MSTGLRRLCLYALTITRDQACAFFRQMLLTTPAQSPPKSCRWQTHVLSLARIEFSQWTMELGRQLEIGSGYQPLWRLQGETQGAADKHSTGPL